MFGTSPPRNDYIGNGTTATYSFGYRIFAATDLKVTVTDTNGVSTLLAYPSDFTVLGASVNNPNGGTLTLINTGVLDGSGFFKTGWLLTIRFSEVTNQPTDLRNQGGFFLEVHEDLFDRVVRFVQQVEDVVKRSWHLPETEVGTELLTTLPAKAVRGSKYAGWDSNGQPVALAPPAGTSTVSSFMAGVLTQADAAAAMTALMAPSISPAQITANQDNYNPASLATANCLRITTDASRNITGLTAPAGDGRLLVIENVGSFNAVLISESGSSTAANRFTLTGDVTLLPSACILLRYDGTSSRWRSMAAPTAPFPIAAAGGTVDAITATFSPALSLTDQTLCAVICTGANATTTPTFAPNGLAAKTITRNGGAALVAGDIGAAGFVALLEYNLANTRWELLNPIRPPSTAGTLTAGTMLTKNPVVFASQTTQAHGLGVEPTFVKIILECITAQASYTTGQRIVWSSFSVSANNSGIAIRMDATNIVLNISNDLTITPDGGGAVVSLTAANWKLFVTPYKLN